jgi:hypothetical protein
MFTAADTTLCLAQRLPRFDIISVDTENVSRFDRPVLLFLNHSSHRHYVVARPIGTRKTKVQLFDASGPAQIVDINSLPRDGSWTGLGLAPRRSAPIPLQIVGSFAAAIVIAIFAVWGDFARLVKLWRSPSRRSVDLSLRLL